jgi:hypothetical protein
VDTVRNDGSMVDHHRMSPTCQALADRQGGLVSRRQLNDHGVDRQFVRRQVGSRRWQLVGPMVVATFTGALTWEQLMWAGHLHAGPTSAVGGLSSARCQGLEGWQRTSVEILVPITTTVAPLPGVSFTRTRRDLSCLRLGGINSHLLRIEPAVLMYAAERRCSKRAGGGLLAATVQQRLTSAARLQHWLDQLAPLPKSALFRELLTDIAGGSESMAEVDLVKACRRFGLPLPDRQRRRRDRDGRPRWTDAEWQVAGGRTVVLEVDGGFHLDVQHWTGDIRRQRKVSAPHRSLLRCTAWELRVEPKSVVEDLVAHGVVRVSGSNTAR